MSNKREKSAHQPNRIASFFNNLFHSKVKAITIGVEDLTPDDVVVAVMGPTGTGKSSFIEIASGMTGMAGHSLKSCTSKISVVKLSYPGLNLCFVDTPGFDDTDKSDFEIFKMISDWLINSYKNQVLLTGLLYFHRISDNRMTGTSLKYFRIFEQLCGEDFNNIVLTTTMWDEVDERLGAMREEELKNDFWRPMVERGSPIKRFYYTRESALEILAPIFGEVHKRSSLLLQTEVNKHGKQLKDTSAGKALYTQLEELVPRQQNILSKMLRELKDPTDDSQRLQSLMGEYQEQYGRMQRATEDLKRMELSIGNQIQKVSSPGRVSNLPSKSKAKVTKVERELREERETESKDRKKKDLLLGKNKEKNNEELCQDQKKSGEVKVTATTWVDDDRRLWVPRAMELESSRKMSHGSGQMKLRMEKVNHSDLYATLEREKRVWEQRTKERENVSQS